MTSLLATLEQPFRVVFNPSLLGGSVDLPVDGRGIRVAGDWSIRQIGPAVALSWESKAPEKAKYSGSLRVEGGYVQYFVGTNRSKNSGVYGAKTLFIKAEKEVNGVKQAVYFPVLELDSEFVKRLSTSERNAHILGIANLALTMEKGLYLYSGPSKDARLNTTPVPYKEPQSRGSSAKPSSDSDLRQEITVKLPDGKRKTFVPSYVAESSFSVDIPGANGASTKRVPIYEFDDGNYLFFAVRHPKTQKLTVVYVTERRTGVQLSSFEPNILALYGIQPKKVFADTGRNLTVNPFGMGQVTVGIKKATDDKYDYYSVAIPGQKTELTAPWKYAKGTKFETIASDINLNIRQLYNDFTPMNGARFDTLFRATLNGIVTNQQARLGYVQTSDGLRIAAQIADGRDQSGKGTFKIYVLPKELITDEMKADPNNRKWLPTISAQAGIELTRMATLGQIQVTGAATDLSLPLQPGNRPATIKLNALQQTQWESMWMLIDAGLIFTAAGRIGAAIKTVRAARAGAAVAPAALKAAEGYLVSVMVGAAAGQANYWIFMDRKYVVEAIDALQKGKPFESLSYGAKAAIQFLTWSVGAGALSGEIAANVNIGLAKKLAENRLGSPKNWLDNVNWGMFVDPSLYTSANVRRVMGGAGEVLVSKYNAVLTYIEQNPRIVLRDGKLNIPEDVIRSAKIPGVTNNAELAKSFITDGMWRIFNATPIPFTPLKFASTSSFTGTLSATTQLVMSRAGIAMAANVVFQNLNSLAMNGSVGINWVQLFSSGLGGATRSAGAPAAWLAPTIWKRLVAYTPSSVAAFLEGIALKGYFGSRKASFPNEFKNDEAKYSAKQLQIMGNANQAFNAAALLFKGLSDSGTYATKANLDLAGQYFAKAAELKAASADNLQVKAAALDKWLDGNAPGTTVSRRAQLSSFQLDLVPGLDRIVKSQIDSGATNISVGTGTFADLGIAPKFSVFKAAE